MRVVDLDRDMSDVIPTGTAPDAAFVFERMRAQTLACLGDVAGARVLDHAGGLGQDARELAARVRAACP